jgi:hypothetical protein
VDGQLIDAVFHAEVRLGELQREPDAGRSVRAVTWCAVGAIVTLGADPRGGRRWARAVDTGTTTAGIAAVIAKTARRAS